MTLAGLPVPGAADVTVSALGGPVRRLDTRLPGCRGLHD